MQRGSRGRLNLLGLSRIIRLRPYEFRTRSTNSYWVFSSSFSALVNLRIAERLPPLNALRETFVLPLSDLGPVDFCQGFQL